MPKDLMWSDVEDIGIALFDRNPELDPLTVRFTELLRMIAELPNFKDDAAKSNESKLEAVQMAWYEEFKDAQ